MSSKLRILICAYACSPYRGSEHAVGWGFINTLARSDCYELWVIAEEKFKKEVDQYIKEHPNFPDSVKFFSLRRKRNKVLKKIWPPSYYWYYNRWHREAFSLAKELHKKVQFDIVHQLTMVGFREPGYLWKLDAPFVWGPIGGFVQMPLRFLSILGPYGTIYYLGRNIMNYIHMRFLRRPKLAAEKAGSGLISATKETADWVKKYWRKESHVIYEVGISDVFVNEVNRRKDKELRLIWSGKYLPRKALPILLYALSMLPKNTNYKLDIIGSGPEEKRWKKIAFNLGIYDRCIWHGWVSRKEALEIMRKGHVFILTSLQDLTTTVVLEALASGLPVICLDHCGFSEVITEECGIKIPVTNIEDVAKNITRAIKKLEDDENLRFKMSEASIRRAKEFKWDKKVEKLKRIYKEVIKDK